MKYNKIILNTSKFYNKTLIRHGSNSKDLVGQVKNFNI